MVYYGIICSGFTFVYPDVGLQGKIMHPFSCKNPIVAAFPEWLRGDKRSLIWASVIGTSPDMVESFQ